MANTGRVVRENADFAAPLLFLGVLNTAGTVAAPLLWSIPLLLIAFSPRLPFLAVAATSTGLLAFLVVATIRLCVADPFNYALGRRHGRRAMSGLAKRIRWRPRAIPQRIRAAACPEHPGHRALCASMVLLRPNARVLAWAGSIDLGGRRTMAIDVVGTAVYAWLVYLGVGALV